MWEITEGYEVEPQFCKCFFNKFVFKFIRKSNYTVLWGYISYHFSRLNNLNFFEFQDEAYFKKSAKSPSLEMSSFKFVFNVVSLPKVHLIRLGKSLEEWNRRKASPNIVMWCAGTWGGWQTTPWCCSTGRRTGSCPSPSPGSCRRPWSRREFYLNKWFIPMRATICILSEITSTKL